MKDSVCLEFENSRSLGSAEAKPASATRRDYKTIREIVTTSLEQALNPSRTRASTPHWQKPSDAGHPGLNVCRQTYSRRLRC